MWRPDPLASEWTAGRGVEDLARYVPRAIVGRWLLTAAGEKSLRRFRGQRPAGGVFQGGGDDESTTWEQFIARILE